MSSTSPSKKGSWLAWLAPPVMLGGLALLFCLPPTEGSYYPGCMFHRLTGWHCPGCGMTRCLYHLLHGDLGKAVGDNILLLVAIPFLVYWGLRTWVALITGRSLRTGRIPTWLTSTLVGAVLVFWVVRNIPCAPFTALAPPPLPPLPTPQAELPSEAAP